MALLEVKDLVVHYGKALALDGASLTVASGELVAVLGPNGAGKTTLLKAVSRAVPSRGEIVFDGQSLAGIPAHAVVGRGICHCPEGRRLFPVLRERRRQQASTLSGGEQQMVAIGRALMGRPKLLLLDEPSVGIAHRLKLQIFQSIRQIQQSGTAVLLVEQDALSALDIATRIYLLEHGRIAREGQSAALANDDYIRQVYLGV